VKPKRCRVRFSAEAEKDFARILTDTRDNFGPRQVEIYRATLREAIKRLEFGPEVLSSRALDEVRRGLRVLHIARKGRRGRYLLAFRADDGQTIEIIRILHDSMNIERHMPPGTD